MWDNISMKTVEYIGDLNIDDYIDKASKVFVMLFCGGTKTFDDLSSVDKNVIRAAVKNKISSGKLGELLAASWLVDNNFEIGWSNIRINMPGKREADGMDLLVRKDLKPFITEVKSNYKSPLKLKSLQQAKSGAFKELSERLKDKSTIEMHIYSIAQGDGVSWLSKNDIQGYKDLIRDVKGKAVISTGVPKSENTYIGKEFQYDFTILQWKDISEPKLSELHEPLTIDFGGEYE